MAERSARSRSGAAAGLGGGRGLLGNALSFVQVMRELDLGEIQRQLALPVRVLVTGTDTAQAARIAEHLFGAGGPASWSVAVAPLSEGEASQDRPNLVLLVTQGAEDPLSLLGQYRRGPRQDETPVLALLLRDPSPDPPEARDGYPPRFASVEVGAGDVETLTERVPPAVLDLVPELGLALGRRFPVFRAEVAERLTRETSRANAQFALVSSLPANLPIVGGLASGAADLVLLTKNQALLVYKLAGLYGRDLEERVSLAIEIAPVVGGAFFWRSLARTLLGMLPTLVGGLPKAAVAYAGTYAVGEMARYYYNTGRRPPPELVARFQAEGSRLAREVAARLEQWGQGRRGP